MNDHFLGAQGFVWWTGIIENRIDPLKTGRAQIRIFGWNEPNKALQPTEQLIWAHPILPLNSESIKLPVEGKMVFGFFMDGDSAQYPVMMGQIPGIPDTQPDKSQGFSDPRTDTQLTNSPRPPAQVDYSPTDGQGVKITEAKAAAGYPSVLNEPTTSRIARNENIDKTAIGRRQKTLVTKVPVASVDPSNPIDVGWDEPKTTYNTVYPHNQVTETESGHVIELDDTPGVERIHIFHRSGSFDEYAPDGSKISKVTKNKTEIVMGGSNKYVMGAEVITINGKETVLIQSDYNITVMGDTNVTILGKADITVEGDVNLNVNGNVTGRIKGDLDVEVGGIATLTYSHLFLNGDVTINGNMNVTGIDGGIGNITVNGDVHAKGVGLLGHTHTNVQNGGGTSGPPVQ